MSLNADGFWIKLDGAMGLNPFVTVAELQAEYASVWPEIVV